MPPITSTRSPFTLESPGIELDEEGFTFDPSKDLGLPDLEGIGAVKDQLQGLFRTIGEAFDSLKKAGKGERAFRLRDAAERFRRTGSQLGINSFARARALTNLQREMEASGREVDARNLVTKLNAQIQIAGDLARVNQQAFSQSMTRVNFREAKLQQLLSLPEREAQQVSPLTRARSRTALRDRQRSLGTGGVAERSRLSKLFDLRAKERRGIDLMQQAKEARDKRPLQAFFAEQAQQAPPIGVTTGPVASPLVAANLAFLGGGRTGVTGASRTQRLLQGGQPQQASPLRTGFSSQPTTVSFGRTAFGDPGTQPIAGQQNAGQIPSPLSRTARRRPKPKPFGSFFDSSLL